MKDLFREMPILATVFTLMIAAVVYFGIDIGFSYPKESNGIVIGKYYVPSRSTVGSGVALSTGGQPTVIMTSDYESEKHLVMVQTPSDSIISVKCSKELFYRKKKGDQLNYDIQVGCFSKCHWDYYGNY